MFLDYSPPHVPAGQTHKTPYSNLKEQKAFEKGLLEKTVKTKYEQANSTLHPYARTMLMWTR
jgi:hypothetical protein